MSLHIYSVRVWSCLGRGWVPLIPDSSRRLGGFSMGPTARPIGFARARSSQMRVECSAGARKPSQSWDRAQAWAHQGPMGRGRWGPNLGPSWAHGGTSLGPSCAHGGPSLGPSWAHGGPSLGHYVKVGPKLGPIMGPWGPKLGSITGPWGPKLGPAWARDGPKLGPITGHGGPKLGPIMGP